jgi:hypothetical protein
MENDYRISFGKSSDVIFLIIKYLTTLDLIYGKLDSYYHTLKRKFYFIEIDYSYDDYDYS